MNKKFLSAILFGALMVTSTGTFVSCKDFGDDIDNVQEQVNAAKSDISALQSQVATLQTALTTAQSTADAAKSAAAAAQATGDAALAAAEAAKAAAAQAKADAIAKAIEEVEALKAWVVSQNYVTEEQLAEALLPISAKISAIEESLDQIIVYIQENLEANIQTALKNIMTLQEDLAIQQETLDNYAAIMEELGAADQELWAEIASTREGLQESVSALNNLLNESTEGLYGEIASTREGLQQALSALNNIVGENYEALTTEIATTREGLQQALTALNNLLDDAKEELAAEIATTREELQEVITTLINTHTTDVEEIQNEIGAIYTLVGETSTHLNNLIADNAAEIESLWKALEANKSELKAEITENYNAIVKLNSNLATLHTLVKTRLTSLLFAPSYYVDGIEAIPFRTLKYNPWINLMTANEGQETKELTLSDGTTQAAYFASPSTIDLSAIEGYNVLLNDASNLKSRATDAITATFNKFENGKLIVDLKKNSSEVFGGLGDEFKVMALQAVLAGEEGATVTSDWARIYEAHYLPQIHTSKETFEKPHLWSYTQGKAAPEGQLILATSDYMTPINLNKLVTVCLTDLEDLGAEYDDKEGDIEPQATESFITLSAEEIKAYGMKFKFDLVKTYKLKEGTPEETDQQKFATIAVDENGDYIITSCAMNGATENKDAIGREPLVQVQLIDEVNGKVVDVNYFKIKWTAVTNSIELGALEPVFEGAFECGKDYTFTVKTEKMNEFFYTALNISKEEFHLMYKPDNYPNGFVVRNAKGEEIEDAGSIMQTVAQGSTTTYNIEWKYTTGAITKEEWAAKKVERTVYLTYVNQANASETITFSMSFVLNIEDMALAAGYVQTYWSGELVANNAAKMFQVNPALTSDKNYGLEAGYETCRIITNMMHGYNVAGIDADKLTIKDIVSKNVVGAEFVFDAEKAAEMNEDWTVSEDGLTLLVDGEEAARITVVDGKAYIKLFETDNTWNVATEAAKSLVGKKVPVMLVGTHCSGYTTVLDQFLVHFIEPLAAKFNMTDGKLEDLLTEGATLDIRTAVTVAEKFGLKRDVIYVDANGKLAANSELVSWYAVKPATWDLENAKTNLNINGNNLVITDKFDTNFAAHSDKYQLEVVKNASGYPVELKFHNFSGTHIQQAFKVQIPVYVETKWNSKLTAEPTYVEVTIVPGVTE